ncbi:hypothetical protein ACFLQN_03775 [Candidatus Aenigmatarchaeota archaeon]
MKAQIGMEFILLFGLLLAAMVPVIIYSTEMSTVNIRTTKSREALNQIGSAVDSIHKLGGGKTTILVDFPYGIDSYLVENKTMKLRLKFENRFGYALVMTNINVTGNLTTEKGAQRVNVEMLNKDLIEISIGDG